MGICCSRSSKLENTMLVDVDARHQGEPFTQEPWDDLPEHVLHMVFAQIKDGRELARCSTVNKSWPNSMAHPQLWQAAAKALRLPDCPLKAYRTAVSRAGIADANTRQARWTSEQTIQHPNGVWFVSFSPDASKLATGSIGSTARLTDAHTGATLATIQHESWVVAVSFSPDGSKLATGSADGTARLTDVHMGAPMAIIQHENGVCAVSLSPDGSKLATGSADCTARLTDFGPG